MFPYIFTYFIIYSEVFKFNLSINYITFLLIFLFFDVWLVYCKYMLISFFTLFYILSYFFISKVISSYILSIFHEVQILHLLKFSEFSHFFPDSCNRAVWGICFKLTTVYLKQPKTEWTKQKLSIITHASRLGSTGVDWTSRLSSTYPSSYIQPVG